MHGRAGLHLVEGRITSYNVCYTKLLRLPVAAQHEILLAAAEHEHVRLELVVLVLADDRLDLMNGIAQGSLQAVLLGVAKRLDPIGDLV